MSTDDDARAFAARAARRQIPSDTAMPDPVDSLASIVLTADRIGRTIRKAGVPEEHRTEVARTLSNMDDELGSLAELLDVPLDD